MDGRRVLVEGEDDEKVKEAKECVTPNSTIRKSLTTCLVRELPLARGLFSPNGAYFVNMSSGTWPEPK